ncbi:MAG: hypothetical protein FJX34_01985, partial [Alphaproteobacteria bacterium]|nr:hypothetical protein [Alphaproteobacteria bacterium]
MRKTGEKKTSLHSSIIGSQTKEELAEEKKRLAGEITNKKQPLLIYIAESDHADATYGSLAEQLINESKKS